MYFTSPHLTSPHLIPYYLILSYLILSYLISSHLISSHLISPHLISSHLILSYLILSYLISITLIITGKMVNLRKGMYGAKCRCYMAQFICQKYMIKQSTGTYRIPKHLRRWHQRYGLWIIRTRDSIHTHPYSYPQFITAIKYGYMCFIS